MASIDVVLQDKVILKLSDRASIILRRLFLRESEVTVKSLNSLFNPRNIAVIGASKDPEKLGYVLLKNVIDYKFKGAVYPVNPKAEVILNKKAYPNISSIPDTIDLALLSIPNHLVLEVVEECKKSNVKAIVILSSGFGEASVEGEKAQDKIRSICQSSGMRVLGPNCMGIYNISDNLNGTYFWQLPRIKGNISFVSQSGAYGGILFNEIRQRRIGISKFVSVGNMVDINHTDVLRYLLADENTQTIAVFIESIKDGREFMEVASEVSKVKPIVAFKAGRTEAGTRAAKSHTGAMAGQYGVYKAAFKQSGVILAENSEEFFDVTMALSSWSHSLPKNNNLAILTISGGPCVAASDTCEEVGLGVPKFIEKTRNEIRKYIPFFGADSNPVDMTPQMDPANYEACVDTVFSQDEISGVIGLNVGLDKKEFASSFVKASKKYGKPIVSFTIDTPELSRIFYDNHIPIYPTPERSVHAYNGLVRYSKYLKSRSKTCTTRHKKARAVPLKKVATESSKILNQLSKNGGKNLTEYESSKILKEYGIPVCREFIVRNIREALSYAKDIGYPVVLKIHSREALHKSETGGVFVGLKNEAELKNAFQKLLENFGKSSEFLIQEFIPQGVELIIGGKRDPIFGPTVLFGLGGVLTEVLKDISLRVCPINKAEAMEMIKEIKGYSLLKGYREEKGIEIGALAEVLVRVSDFLLGNPNVKELDINPLIAHEKKLFSVDSLIVLT
ncbi:MAG: acetate--CoA ligase family protein [Candidatus Aminicenantaceae bacterium]